MALWSSIPPPGEPVRRLMPAIETPHPPDRACYVRGGPMARARGGQAGGRVLHQTQLIAVRGGSDVFGAGPLLVLHGVMGCRGFGDRPRPARPHRCRTRPRRRRGRPGHRHRASNSFRCLPFVLLRVGLGGWCESRGCEAHAAGVGSHQRHLASGSSRWRWPGRGRRGQPVAVRAAPGRVEAAGWDGSVVLIRLPPIRTLA